MNHELCESSYPSGSVETMHPMQLNDFTVIFRRLLAPCIRKRRLLLSIVILYGIATYFLRDQIMNAFSHISFKTSAVQTITEETPMRKLIFLQVLFRHGHHSPFSIFPTDTNPESYWVEGLGQLTKIGRLQHYVLGQYLRKMYEDFLNHSVQEVECMSSLASRSLYGAYAFLAGFYPAPPDKRVDEDQPYQPIPCSYLPLETDMYLQSLPNCAASEMDKTTMLLTKEAKQFMSGYEKTENLTIPDWAVSTWESLKQNSDICYHFHFKTRLLHRLRAGPVIGEIVGKMKDKIQNPKSKLKAYVYSGHGSNVAAVLNALRVFNHRVPTYASTILFELHKEEEGRHTVRLLLSNATQPEKYIPPLHILQLPGCGEYCSLEELERQTADLYPLDWEKECQEIDKDRIRQLVYE
ncbi:Prostatic acid phosphatase like protein [Argiope bruennichi]|uniref:acid phosphatase n=1 Tax=Argiope bruennichi TaxID=94029 RepID=A0A8T0G3I3_ARGBR|nr:Prostatic acid phosphatase like protein [Argiope bruennichi]